MEPEESKNKSFFVVFVVFCGTPGARWPIWLAAVPGLCDKKNLKSLAML
jgi:hypothetical protein